MYSHGFDFAFFTKNLVLTVAMGGLFWYFLTPLLVGASRIQGLVYILEISVIAVIPFMIMNRQEGKMFLGELKKMRKGG